MRIDGLAAPPQPMHLGQLVANALATFAADDEGAATSLSSPASLPPSVDEISEDAIWGDEIWGDEIWDAGSAGSPVACASIVFLSTRNRKLAGAAQRNGSAPFTTFGSRLAAPLSATGSGPGQRWWAHCQVSELPWHSRISEGEKC